MMRLRSWITRFIFRKANLRLALVSGNPKRKRGTSHDPFSVAYISNDPWVPQWRGLSIAVLLVGFLLPRALCADSKLEQVLRPKLRQVPRTLKNKMAR